MLLRIGLPIWASTAVAFGCFALSGFAVYGGLLPPQGISLVAALALGIGGLAPGALYAAAPHAAPRPSTVPPTIGLLQQASSFGQFAGPLVLGVWVEHFGWHAAPAILTPAALFGLASAFVLRRILVIPSFINSDPSCPGLTRASIRRARRFCEDDGLPGQARQ